jgi:hypothetical protein
MFARSPASTSGVMDAGPPCSSWLWAAARLRTPSTVSSRKVSLQLAQWYSAVISVPLEKWLRAHSQRLTSDTTPRETGSSGPGLLSRRKSGLSSLCFGGFELIEVLPDSAHLSYGHVGDHARHPDPLERSSEPQCCDHAVNPPRPGLAVTPALDTFGMPRISWRRAIGFLGSCRSLMSNLELHWGEHAKRRVPALAIMEDLQVFEASVGELCAGAPPLSVEQFDLHSAPKRLDDGVVIAIAN